MPKHLPTNEEEARLLSSYLTSFRGKITHQLLDHAWESYIKAYQGWESYRIEQTLARSALVWYQQLHRPLSKEYRPSVILAALWKYLRQGE